MKPSGAGGELHRDCIRASLHTEGQKAAAVAYYANGSMRLPGGMAVSEMTCRPLFAAFFLRAAAWLVSRTGPVPPAYGVRAHEVSRRPVMRRLTWTGRLIAGKTRSAARSPAAARPILAARSHPLVLSIPGE